MFSITTDQCFDVEQICHVSESSVKNKTSDNLNGMC